MEEEVIVTEPLDAKTLILKAMEESDKKEKECAAKLLAAIKAVGLAGKDLHYRAKGEAFYSEHLLADLAWNIERLTDDFIEVFYLGEKEWTPPTMASVYQNAALSLPFVGEESEEASTEFWARRLLKTCETLVEAVEIAKNELSVRAGVQAALDETSKQALQVAGLLKRNLK